MGLGPTPELKVRAASDVLNADARAAAAHIPEFIALRHALFRGTHGVAAEEPEDVPLIVLVERLHRAFGSFIKHIHSLGRAARS